MKQSNGRRSGLPWRIVAVLGILTLLIGLGLGVSGFLPAVKTPEQIRAEKLEFLCNAENGFSEETIVLRNVPQDRARTLADKLQARMRSTTRGDFTVLYLPEGVTIRDVYEDDSNLEYISEMEPDYYAYTGAVSATGQELLTSRPEYEVTDPAYDLATQLEYVRMGTVWEQTRGSGVTVAIIDTGIDTDHPEFEGRISEASYNASEDKTVRDYGMEMIEDEVGHGTAVAGVLGAAMNNGVGITGIAPEAELLIIKCQGDGNGNFTRSSDLVFALAYAIECDADVINMSFSVPVNIFETYTQLAVDSDIVCVASAGNNGGSLEMYPAADPNVIGVGAMDPETWTLADYSNYGDNSDLLAPGTVYTTDLNGDYAVQTGTSVASPMVAGAVALYLAENPYQELSDIRAVLEASCVDLGSLGEDWSNGFGALDISAMVIEPKGTITYDMLTDEVRGLTQRFVVGRTVQTMPEPERENVAFDGWYFDPQCTDECEYYTDVFSQDITLYAGWINEDDGTAYIYTILDDGTAEIQSYTGKRRYLTVPDQIEGYTVTSLGEQAFAGNTRLRSVKLPATLTNIGVRAFYGCTNLLNIEIPEAVKTIGDEALRNCVRLRTVGIVAGGALERIGDYAFAECAISTIDLPENLHTLGEGFLLGCGIRTVTVAEGNTAFKVLNSGLYDISGQTLIYCPTALTGEYTVAAGTTAIGKYAFYGSRFSQITLPEGLVSIADESFQGSAVESVSLPSSVTELGQGVWYNCRNMTQVDLSGATGITTLPAYSFGFCAALQEIVIPDWIQSLGNSVFGSAGLIKVHFGADSALTSIGSSAFCGCPLEQFSLPVGVKSIANSAFYRCLALETFTFAPDSALTTIGSSAFGGCYRLTQMDFPESLTTVQSMAFYGSGLTQLHLGKNVATLGAGALAGCRSLPAITVDAENASYAAADGVLFTADYATLVTFPAGKSGSYTLPETVTRIGDYGFSCAEKLTDVTMNEGLTRIGAFSFEYCCALRTPTLPESLDTIGEYGFSYCTAMSDPLLIPKNVISLGRYAFYQDYALTTIEIAADSVLSRIGYGSFANCGITAFRIPASIASMGQDVFAGCRDLETVTFAAGCRLENLAAWTFRNASALKEIVFEEGCALKNIEARALEQLPALEKINLESCTGLTVINNYAFQFCSSLKQIDLPAAVTEIGRYAFSGCSDLSEIIIPAGTEFIGRYAFAGTKNLKVYFEAPVLPLYLQEYWDYGIFGYYLGTSSIQTSGDWTYTLTAEGEASIVSYTGTAAALEIDTIDGYPVAAIGSGAFRNNTTLTSVTLPDTLLGIYKNAFEGTASLTSIAIPDSVTVIDEYAFRGSGISAVELGENSSLTVLGRYAFADTANLTAFTLPAAVEKIRDYTFSGSGIRTFTLPSETALTEIGRNAFSGSALTAVELPDGLTKIDYYAFSGCAGLGSVTFGTEAELMIYANAFYQTGLTTVDIPANVTYLGEFCFTDCTALKTINVAQDNVWYAGLDGVLYSKDLSRLICCPAGKTGALTVPDQVASLAFGAFEGSSLSEITISDNSRLSTLGYRAFFRCQNLEQITIPDGLQSIDRYAFAYCPKLTTVTIGPGSQLGGIYYAAFYQCPSLTAIYIPAGVQEIDDYAFYNCTSLADMTMADDSQLKFIGDYAFQNTAVKELTMPVELYEIGHYAFQNSGLETLVVNETVFWIGDYAFADCGLSNTTVLTFPENMEYLGELALKGVTALEELTVPFLGTTVENPVKLNNLVGDGGITATSSSMTDTLHTVHVLHGDIVDFAFTGLSQIQTITVGSDCETIGYMAMMSTGITSFHFTESIREIEYCALAQCTQMETITLDPNNPNYQLIDGLLYNKAGTELLIAPGKISGSITIPETVTRIGDSAFQKCENLTNVIFPDTLTEIGKNAFAYCSALEEIILPDSLTALGGSAFSTCSSVKKIVIGTGLRLIPSFAFRDCGVTELDIKEGITEIGTCAFLGCNSLKTVSLPDSLEKLGEAFYLCMGLESVDLGDSLRVLGEGAFEGCRMLENITLPESLETIETKALSGTGITTLHIPRNVTTFAEGTVEGCSKLASITVDPENTSYCAVDGCLYDSGKTVLLVVPSQISGEVAIPEGVTSLADSAFSSCKKLTNVIIPDSVTSIGSGCFAGCAALESIVLPNGITELKENLFSSCTKLREIVVPDSVTVIGSYCFYSCTSLERVVLPEGLIQLGNDSGGGCFRYCKALKSITLPDSLELISSFSFADCTALTEINMGENTTSFGRSVLSNSGFYNDADNWENGILYLHDICVDGKTADGVVRIRDGIRVIGEEAFDESPLDTLVLPDSVEYINAYAFLNCPDLTVVRMSRNVKNIGYIAFSGCSSLRSMYLPETAQQLSSILGNSTGATFQDMDSILIESAACLESFRMAGHFDLKALVVPYTDAVTIGRVINGGTPHMASVEKIVVTGNHMTAAFLNGVDSSTAVYCQVPEGYFTYNGSSTIYYEGEWHLAAFWSDGALVQAVPYTIGSVIEVPSAETMAPYALGGDAFAGWDINGDGAVDQIPATLSSDLVAEAVWGHTHTPVTDPAVEATCTETGLTEGSHCSECGAVIVAQEVIPMKDHDYQSVVTAPTCTEQGYTTHTCSACGDSYVADFVDAGHTYVDGICEVCGEGQIVGGECGTNVIWTLQMEDGTLRISGVGTAEAAAFSTQTVTDCFMDDYTCAAETPWYAYQDRIVTIVVEDGVASIGDNAFAGCENLTTVTIGEDVSAIGSCAFADCGKLETVTFTGDAPDIQTDTFESTDVTVSYPADNETWTEDVKQDYGGNLDWEDTSAEPVYTATYTNASISLAGDIGVNYYAELSEDLVASEGAYMQFTVAGQTQTVPVSEAEVDANGVYRFSCKVAAKQMTEEITGQMYLSDGTAVGEPKIYSVKAYCDAAIPVYSQYEAYADLVALMKAMLNYGGCSQVQFGYNTENLANAGMDTSLPALTAADLEAYAHGAEGSEDGISVASVSLLLESTTTIRFYFNLDGTRSIDEYTFLVDGVETAPVQSGENQYYVDKVNVAAKDLDEMVTVTVGGLTVKYCGLSYVRQVAVLYPNYYSEALVNVAKALYAYNQAANAHFG